MAYRNGRIKENLIIPVCFGGRIAFSACACYNNKRKY
jgi:hypothetical protein